MRTWVIVLFVALIPALFLAALVPAPAQVNRPVEASGRPVRIQQLGDEGMTRLMNGHPDSAIAVSREIQEEDSTSPLGYLLAADATWWKIYYTTANLIDPDVFDVVSSTSTPYDSQFQNLTQTTIQKAKARTAQHQDVARSTMYEGLAYALLGRLDGLRAQDLAAARDGKKMRSLLLAALRLDPHLTDSYAGVGLYNYYVATLPTIIKWLRFLIGLPGGSRRVGLQQLADAAEHGEFVRAEAKFYLAKNYTRNNERQFGKASQLFEELSKEYPQNPFWKLMVASVTMRLGQTQQGDALYRQIQAETAGGGNLVAKSVHSAVVKALERLHPQEKFE